MNTSKKKGYRRLVSDVLGLDKGAIIVMTEEDVLEIDRVLIKLVSIKKRIIEMKYGINKYPVCSIADISSMLDEKEDVVKNYEEEAFQELTLIATIAAFENCVPYLIRAELKKVKDKNVLLRLVLDNERKRFQDFIKWIKQLRMGLDYITAGGKKPIVAILAKSTFDFDISVRARNVLSNLGIETIGDLIIKKEQEISRRKNCGPKTVKEIKEKILDPYKLKFGMEIPKDLF